MIVTSAGLLASVHTGVISGGVRSIRNANREFTRDLSWRAIGVHASQVQAIEYAAEYGFESVYADAGYLSSLNAGARADLASLMKEKDIVWGAGGLTVDFRKDESTFREGLKKLPAIAKAA